MPFPVIWRVFPFTIIYDGIKKNRVIHNNKRFFWPSGLRKQGDPKMLEGSCNPNVHLGLRRTRYKMWYWYSPLKVGKFSKKVIMLFQETIALGEKLLLYLSVLLMISWKIKGIFISFILFFTQITMCFCFWYWGGGEMRRIRLIHWKIMMYKPIFFQNNDNINTMVL